MFARIATRTGVQLPSPPVFARNKVESEDCRAVVLAKAGLCRLQCQCCELRLGRPPSNASVHLRVHSAKRNRPETFLHWPHGRSSPATDSSQCRQSPTHSKTETLARQNLHRILRPKPRRGIRTV